MSLNRRRFIYFAASTALLSGCGGPPTVAKSGGVVLVYKVANVDPKSNDLEASTLARDVLRRLDRRKQFGVAVSIKNNSEVHISIPNQERIDAQRAKQLLSLNGDLRFLIAANELEHSDLIEVARSSPSRVVEQGGLVIGKWFTAARSKNPAEPYDMETLGQVLRDAKTGSPVVWTKQQLANSQGVPTSLNAILSSRGINDLEVLVAIDEPGKNFSSKHLSTVRLTKMNGRPAIAFSTSNQGKQILESVTNKSALGGQRNLAIILDHKILTMPRLHSPIGQYGQITGDFSQAEAQLIVDVLQVGKLPYELISPPISETIVNAAAN